MIEAAHAFAERLAPGEERDAFKQRLAAYAEAGVEEVGPNGLYLQVGSCEISSRSNLSTTTHSPKQKKNRRTWRCW
jgi:hypothetical protein